MLLLGIILSAGCAPTCDQTCSKLAGCDQIETSEEECTSACNAQQNLYEDWGDEDKITAFEELKECVADSECGSVADGVCYDSEIFVW